MKLIHAISLDSVPHFNKNKWIVVGRVRGGVSSLFTLCSLTSSLDKYYNIKQHNIYLDVDDEHEYSEAH